MKSQFLAMTLLAASGSVSAAEPITIFGIELGKPLSLPECSYQMGGSMKLYDTIAKVECQEVQRPDSAPGVTWSRVHFPPDRAPLIAKWSYVNAYMLNGVVEGIEFPTAGVSSQEVVVAQLKQKFGAPSAISNRLAQNAMGATFTVIEAQWRTEMMIVTFHGALDQFDKGKVEICQNSLCDVRRGKEQADQSLRQRL